MTFIVITILLSCLSVMAVRGQRGTWPTGMPVARPRLSAVGGAYEGSHRRPSDTDVIQEPLIAADDEAAHRSVGAASPRDPATSRLVSTLDLIILDSEDGSPPRVFDEMAALEPKDDAFVTT